MNYEDITLEEILAEIGDDVGRKYSWFLIAVDAIGYDVDNKTIWRGTTWGEIANKCRKEEHYEIEWEFLKKITPKIRTVEDFIFYGCKDREKFLAELHISIEQKGPRPNCELEFEIVDGEIWEINGTDVPLVARLRKTFLPSEFKYHVL